MATKKEKDLYINNKDSNLWANVDVTGDNGLSGVKKWECYMLIKYGKANKFDIGGKYEYLIDIPVYPEQLTEQIAPQWKETNVLGRSSPLASYGYTGLKTVQFSLELHRDLLTGNYSLEKNVFDDMKGAGKNNVAGYQLEKENNGSGPFYNRLWYLKFNKMLQMACYPQYTSSGLLPPTTYFIFGQAILKGFVTNYSSTWKKPIVNTFYSNNHVDISMSCYPDSIISADDLTKSNNTQNTYNTEYPSGEGNSDIMTRKYTSLADRTKKSIGGNPMQT